MSYLMKLFKQPLIIGYILAWILISPNLLWLLQHTESVELFSHLWVTILLFMVGLGLNPRVIKELGKPSLLVGIGQVILTVAIGVWISLLLWFDLMTSMYIALALAFSSTIIIVKFLSDKGTLDELYGKISIGMLIVQDMIAMVILMVLSSLPTGEASVDRLSFGGFLLFKIIAIALVFYSISVYILPRVLKYIAQSQEFLLVFAIGWCLLCAASMEAIGFSLEIGALLAGLSLASLPYRFEIASKMKSLRDFFVVLFFVFLGSQLQFVGIGAYIVPIIVLSLFVLIGKPLIVMGLMGLMWYKKKNWLLVGTTIAQVSEFSFILMAVAISIGHITDTTIVSMVTIVWLVTIAGSSYYMTYADMFYKKISWYLTVFERKVTTAEQHMVDKTEQYDIIVFGNHRTGEGVVNMLIKNKKNFVIVDYDPQVIRSLEKKWLPCRYWDASDIDTLEELNLHQAKMIVSTVHDLDASMLILQESKKHNPTLVTIMSANKVSDAELLYEQWANYVLVPHVIGWHHTAMMIEQYEYDIEKYAQKKMEEYKVLM